MDRTFRGLIAGIIAGIIMNIWNLTDFYLFRISNLRLLDWVAVLTSGEKSRSVFQSITDLIIQLIWDGFLGVIFAHLLVKITSEGIIVKSVIFGTLCWFLFRALAIVFKVTPLIAGYNFPSRLSSLLGAVLWGVVLGFFLKKFEEIPENREK